MLNDFQVRNVEYKVLLWKKLNEIRSQHISTGSTSLVFCVGMKDLKCPWKGILPYRRDTQVFVTPQVFQARPQLGLLPIAPAVGTKQLGSCHLPNLRLGFSFTMLLELAEELEYHLRKGFGIYPGREGNHVDICFFLLETIYIYILSRI